MRRALPLVMGFVLFPAFPLASEAPVSGPAGSPSAAAPTKVMQGTWKPVDDEDGIKIWKLVIPGRELPGFRGETVIDAPAERIVDTLKHVEQHTQWMHRCAESKVLKTINADEVIIYNRTDTPWPVWDRDAVLATSFTRSEDGKAIILTFKTTNAQPQPLPERVVRMPRLEGSYTMSPLSDGRTKVVYQVEVDIGGSVPTWAAERVARDMPYETLFRLRKRVGKSVGAR